ncbi:hypothetical protein AYI68_g3216 [Smittium mucronatum]|uniref:Uncharacterized protein n=1 Tax=Smittium mucronatum TaxID=133383 RepID=A0A1R0H0I3_9FUNG|nr:hypothetical protein AYI68_g3216 [Smittium mucronatum]
MLLVGVGDEEEESNSTDDKSLPPPPRPRQTALPIWQILSRKFLVAKQSNPAQFPKQSHHMTFYPLIALPTPCTPNPTPSLQTAHSSNLSSYCYFTDRATYKTLPINILTIPTSGSLFPPRD